MNARLLANAGNISELADLAYVRLVARSAGFIHLIFTDDGSFTAAMQRALSLSVIFCIFYFYAD